ncbi:MAG TPA: aminopeptidase P N-terminal domain-containing protein, partial [Bacteroidia bacterium]|nr:aminopeptidase P N-terminal domain-containing protein [Bacteroidia bacterium]
MKYLPINNQLFVSNRKRFAALLKPNSIAIFNSNDVLPTNADGSLKFKQNSDLFYLSGIDQEESILVIYPDAKDGVHKEVLFLKETNEHIAIWEGHKLTKAEALTVSGIQKVYWLNEFKTVLRSLMAEAETVYLNTNEHVRAVVETETREARFVKWCMAEYPVHKYERSAPLMHNLRAIKQDTEIELIQQACNITEKGFRRLLSFIKPGVWEYEIEAELIHEFTRHRSNGFAYTPIIASGYNSCV